MRVRSVRDRLGMIAAAAAMLLVVVVGMIGLTQSWRRANSERARTVDERVEALDRELIGGSTFGSGELDARASDAEEFIALLDADGFVFAATSNVDAIDIEDHALFDLDVIELGDLDMAIGEHASSTGTWDTAAITCSDAATCDVVVVGRRPTGWWTYFGSRALVGVLLVGGVGLIIWLGARSLVGHSLRPVERMRRELDSITASDLDRRIAADPTGDELEALAGTMNTTIGRLAGSIRSQRRFVSDSAHELRSPLTGIRATLELAQADDDRRARALDDSIAALDRTSDIVDDLLVLARHDSGVPTRRALTDIDDVIRTEADDLRVRHPELALDRSSIEPIQDRVDGTAIRRLIRNLLDNAASHGDGHARISLHRIADGWTLIVEDDGPGIPEASRQTVFERFARLDEARSRASGGSGLGLAIVAGIVSDHDGTITIDDSGLGGARIRVTVPIARERLR
jgi:signal transduction histidine kinase